MDQEYSYNKFFNFDFYLSFENVKTNCNPIKWIYEKINGMHKKITKLVLLKMDKTKTIEFNKPKQQPLGYSS